METIKDAENLCAWSARRGLVTRLRNDTGLWPSIDWATRFYGPGVGPIKNALKDSVRVSRDPAL